MSSREEHRTPASFVSITVSTSSNEMNHFDHVASANHFFCVPRTRHDGLIYFYRDGPIDKAQMDDQVSKSETLRDFSHSTVYRHQHRRQQ